MNLKRTDYLSSGIFGILDDGNGNTYYTLEHSYIFNAGWVPKIPPGTYTCVLYDSPKHGNVFLLQNVPGSDFDEIHIGCYNKDSEGCILIGLAKGDDMILESGSAFTQFMDNLSGITSFELTIS